MSNIELLQLKRHMSAWQSWLAGSHLHGVHALCVMRHPQVAYVCRVYLIGGADARAPHQVVPLFAPSATTGSGAQQQMASSQQLPRIHNKVCRTQCVALVCCGFLQECTHSLCVLPGILIGSSLQRPECSHFHFPQFPLTH